MLKRQRRQLSLSPWKCLFICAAFLLYSAPVYAEEWWIVVRNDVAGDSVLADADSVESTINGNRRFWVHRFYHSPQNEMASARVEYEVNCSLSAIQERRYTDYDINRSRIGSGDNSFHRDWKRVRPDTSGFHMVKFACMPALDRRDIFERLGEGVSYWETGELLSAPVVAVGSKISGAGQSSGDGSVNARNAYVKYEACAMTAVRNFVRSGETANVISSAALTSCSNYKSKLRLEFGNNPRFNEGHLDRMLQKIDEALTEKLIMNIVQIKSQKSKK